jgi:hypothetical protein
MNSKEESRWSWIKKFITLENPSKLPAPRLYYPEFGSYIPSANMAFFWQSIHDAQSYEFQLSDNNSFLKILVISYIMAHFISRRGFYCSTRDRNNRLF